MTSVFGVKPHPRRASTDTTDPRLFPCPSYALFEIEMPTNTKPAEDVVFTNTVMDFAKAEPGACKGSARGSDDYFSGPVASTDGVHCCVDRIVLRLSGAKPTTMDPAPP